jgi:hypothetical protein
MPVAKVVRRSWNSVVRFTGRTAVQWARERTADQRARENSDDQLARETSDDQWARESNDGRRMAWAVEAGLVVLVAAAALCGVDCRWEGKSLGSIAWLGMVGGSGVAIVGECLLTYLRDKKFE